MPAGLCFVGAGAVLMAVLLNVFEPGVVTVMAPISIWAFGIGMILPGATTSAMASFPRIAGAASALMGFFQIGGGLLGSLVASLVADPIVALTTVIAAMPALAVVIHVALTPAKRREDRLDPADYELMPGSDPAGYIGPPAKRLMGAARAIEKEIEREVKDAAE